MEPEYYRRPGARQRKRAPGARACVGLIFALGVLLAGCGDAVDRGAVLKEVAAGGQDQNWIAIRPQLRALLLDRPDDPVAHYYYGLSFLHLKNPQLTFAEGELLTAQALLENSPALPAGEIDMDIDTFKAVVCQKAALVYMRASREAMSRNIPYDAWRGLLAKATAQVERGLKSKPDSHALKEYADFLKEALNGTPPKAPEIVTRAAGSGGTT